MLVLAAKAAEKDLSDAVWHDDGYYWLPLGRGFWNPLTDDGDALRLAVRLRFLVQIRPTVTFVTDDDGKQLSFRPHRPHQDDPYAATRFAIVRAAAEVGKEKSNEHTKSRG
jgi:hypothetical protein